MSVKKFIISICILFFSFLALSIEPSSIFTKTNEYKLENGCDVFLLEDTSSAFIRIDVSIKAGFSYQTPDNTGFFKLYSRILQNYSSQIRFNDVQCNADSTRYIIEIPYLEFPTIMNELSQLIYSPSFSDKMIEEELSKLKKETVDNEKNPANFINSAIDSRVFSLSPWKHDSGIYPSLLKKSSTEKARSLLASICEKWYIPQNSALFISGNFDSEEALKIIKQTFGAFYSSAIIPSKNPQTTGNSKKKFVLYHKDISPELTQVVVQYTSLNRGQAAVAEEIFNNPSSKVKSDLLLIKELNIPGSDYINISSAGKKDSNRLIIQTLMQTSNDKKNKKSSIQQTNLFIESLTKNLSNITANDFYNAKQNLISKINLSKSSATSFMEQLSDYWAIESYSKTNKENQTSLLFNLMKENDYLFEIPHEEISTQLSEEEPFIFVIINSADYEKNKNEYKKNGFEPVTTTTAAWYNQKEFRDYLNYSIPNSADEDATTDIQQTTSFYTDNVKNIKTNYLQNGIPIFTKKDQFSYQTTFLIKIDGGKINTQSQNGLEEVIISLISNKIENELYKDYLNGLIFSFPSVSYETFQNSSYIKIICDKDDFRTVAKTAASSIIYNKIIPSDADRAVSSKQYKKRLENGSSVNQLYFAAINLLYKDCDFSNIFNTNIDVLQNIKYEDIAYKYPLYLDSSRYSLILSGFIQNDFVDIFEDSFGLLKKLDLQLNTNSSEIQIPKNKSINISINHTFLTDIPAEKAGAMPQILIPTTTFLDPVLFGIYIDNNFENSKPLIEAIFLYIKNEIEESAKQNKRLSGVEVIYQSENKNIPLSFLIFKNVPHTKEIDATYKDALNSLKADLSSTENTKTALQTLKNLWITSQLNKTKTVEGNAELIFESLENANNPLHYLDKYKTIESSEAKDYLDILEKISTTPNIRIYSKDSTK
jgi:predicted Zn-dependent peptidase